MQHNRIDRYYIGSNFHFTFTKCSEVGGDEIHSSARLFAGEKPRYLLSFRDPRPRARVLVPDTLTDIPTLAAARERRTIDDITIGIVGAGGDGVISSGELLVSAAAADGLYATILKSFGPQIRGGESSCRVRISQDEVLSYGDALDVLVAFNWTDFQLFRAELALRPGVVVLYDQKDGTAPGDVPVDPALEPLIVAIPFADLAKSATGTELSKNILLLGVLAELFDLPQEGIADAVARKFRRKGDQVVGANRQALRAGHEYVRDQLADAVIPIRFASEKGDPKLLMTGNEALAFGAIKAGCRFYAGYPITPSSDVMEWLANELPRFGGTMMQTEDEIAAIGMCVGASFGGTKVMTSTAGPGFSLMTEFLGLASMAEIPLVIADIQRVGPSTGIPTKTEQCDFNHAALGGPGDAPRVVLAPYDVADCFHIAVEAFNIAEAYQTPVIVLSDQYLGQRKESVAPFDIHRWPVLDRRTLSSDGARGDGARGDGASGDGGSKNGGKGDDARGDGSSRNGPGGDGGERYKRYRLVEGDVSPMAIPGEPGGMHTVSGLEHVEAGDPTSNATVHERMSAKRHQKLERLAEERGGELVRIFGNDDPEFGVVCWGSTSAQAREAVRRLGREGIRVGVCVPQLLVPLPRAAIQAFVDRVDRCLWVELNHQAQFYHYAAARLDLPRERTRVYSRAGGMPFTVAEIEERIRFMVQGGEA
jgi:2-oxoglutarate ferredoxin oxidoreductase subunit alpha